MAPPPALSTSAAFLRLRAQEAEAASRRQAGGGLLQGGRAEPWQHGGRLGAARAERLLLLQLPGARGRGAGVVRG